MSSSIIKYITILFPIFMILCTAGTVVFSEDGLFENISIYEKILRFEKRAKKIQTENENLKRKIFVLKLRREKVLQEMSVEHFAAPTGAVIYRFEQ
ncbi:MAG: hypothetical protein CL916_10120 [Deltaproteobacteria bacterium]|nr:hypothetical protein [Deltaproteobacteria bacterium]